MVHQQLLGASSDPIRDTAVLYQRSIMATSASQLGETADALVERIFEASLATFDIFAIYLGDRLGYYSALCDGGPMTSQQLADESNTHERYTREWLEQQAVSGIITADTEGAGPALFSIPSGHAEALTHELNSPASSRRTARAVACRGTHSEARCASPRGT
jgi:hypothetical protein